MEEMKTNEKTNSLVIIFDSKNKFNLSSNNPDLDGLIEMVIKLKDNCDFSKIRVETENSDFDIKGFEGILKNSITAFLDDIKVNEENFKKALYSIKNEEDILQCEINVEKEDENKELVVN